MILLDPVVEIAVGPMAHTFAEFGPDRPWIAVMPIRRNPSRRDAGDCFGGAEERCGSRHVAGFTQPNVHQHA